MTDVVQVNLPAHIVDTLATLQNELGEEKMADIMTDIFTLYNALKLMGESMSKDPSDTLEILIKAYQRFEQVAKRGNALCEVILTHEKKVAEIIFESHMPSVLEHEQAAAIRRKALVLASGNTNSAQTSAH